MNQVLETFSQFKLEAEWLYFSRQLTGLLIEMSVGLLVGRSLYGGK